jgi:hypothetical protein
MKALIVVVLLAGANSCFSQDFNSRSKLFLKDVAGRYVDFKPSYGQEGSPFFLDAYTPARLTLGAKTYYIKSKLNLLNSELLFEDEGKEMAATVPVDKVEFFNSKTNGYNLAFRSGFPKAGKNTTATYYHVLDSGKAILLQHIGVRSRETRAYNSATNVLVYEKDKSYYLFVNNSMYPVKKMDDVVDALKDKKKEVDTFISSKKLKMGNEEDLKELVSYYNGL